MNNSNSSESYSLEQLLLILGKVRKINNYGTILYFLYFITVLQDYVKFIKENKAQFQSYFCPG